jgi:hypothetical protein
MKKKIVNKLRKIPIGSLEFILRMRKDKYGASFTIDSVEKNEICIGTKGSFESVCDRVFHECLEAMLTADSKRYKATMHSNNDHTRYTFMFDHDYMNNNLVPGMIQALLASGFFKRCNGRPKVQKKKVVRRKS